MDSFCRFCLRSIKDDTTVELFTPSGIERDTKEKIDKCLSLEHLINHTNMPNKICSSCVIQLDNSYKFYKVFMDTQAKIAEQLMENQSEEFKHTVIPTKDSSNESISSDLIDESYLVLVDDDGNIYEEFLTNEISNDGNDDQMIHNNVNTFNIKSNNINFIDATDHEDDEIANMKKEYSTSTDNVFECQICFCVFRNKNAIYSHMKKHSSKLMSHKELFENYLTGPCNEDEIQKFVSKVIAENSINSSNTGDTFLNSCKLCPAIFATKSELSKHIAQHCESDNMKNSMNSQEKTKVKKETPSQKMFCNICEQGFFLKSRYEQHMKKHNRPQAERKMKNQLFECNDCDKIFDNKIDIQKHVFIHMSNKKCHVCDICGKEYIFRVALLNHKRKHDPNQLFTCHFCLKTFQHKFNLNEHMNTHLNCDDFSCLQCNMYLMSAEDLKKHKELLHSDSVEFKSDNLDFITLKSDNLLSVSIKEEPEFSKQSGIAENQTNV